MLTNVCGSFWIQKMLSSKRKTSANQDQNTKLFIVKNVKNNFYVLQLKRNRSKARQIFFCDLDFSYSSFTSFTVYDCSYVVLRGGISGVE